MPGGIAARVMAWQRRMGAAPGPLRASGEVGTGEPVQVEIWINGRWVDITSYVMVRDDQGHISITYGIRDEGSLAEQSTSTLPLNNRDSRFTRRNPVGPYYGFLGVNTPCRVSVPDGMGGKSYRQQSEISKWPKGWDPTGTDVWVDVGASGLIQRLSKAPPPERSVIYNAVASPLASSVVAYWPCEDPTGSTGLASALTSGSRMTWTGVPTLATYTGALASDPLPDITSASLAGGVAKYADPTATQVRFLAYIPVTGLSDGKVVCAIDQVDYSPGSPQFFEVYYSTTDAINSLVLRACAADGTVLGTWLPHTMDVRGRLLYVSVELQESGTSITRTLRITDVTAGRTVSVTDTEFLTQLTRVTRVAFGIASRAVSGPAGSANLPGVSVGHVTVENAITPIDALGTRLNPIGEPAGRRVQRLCGEQGIPFEWVGDLDDTTPMGAQGKQNLLALVQDAAIADDGLLYETRSQLGLGYRTRASLYNQDPALILDYAAFQLAEIPTPLEDDRYRANRVVVQVGDVTATYEETAGALSTAPPPAGMGVYGSNADSPLSLNLASSDAGNLRDHAAWRVHLGTVDEDRFPQISVNLAHPSITPAMRRAILALRLGDRVQIINAPQWVGPDIIDQLAIGLDESIDHFQHRLTFTCRPSSPYNNVAIVDGPNSRIDIDGSELLTPASAGATSLVVVPSARQTMLWSTDPADLPFDARIGGEVVRVTSVTPWLADAFGRTVASGWGTADTGQGWGTSGGSASDHAVGSGIATHTLTSVDVSRRAFIDATFTDVDYYLDMAVSATPTGGSIYGGPTARYLDSSNMYLARLEITTASVVILSVRKRINDVDTQLAAYTLPDAYVPGTVYRIRFQTMGSTIRAKTWTGVVETPEWQVTAVDSALSTSSYVGMRSIASPTTTNVNPVVRYDNVAVVNPQTLTVTRSINGVTKAQVAGEDIRLANPTYLPL